MKIGTVNGSKKKPSSRTQSSARTEKYKDDAVIALINGIDVLISYAAANKLGPIDRALTCAKETIVYWAVEEDFYESDKDRFVNQRLNHAVPSLFKMLPEFVTSRSVEARNDTMRQLLADTLAPNM